MIPSLREQFNRNFREEQYARFLAMLEARTGLPPLFRHNESPVFLPLSLVARMEEAGRAMMEQLVCATGGCGEAYSALTLSEAFYAPRSGEGMLGDTAYLDAARRRIPPAYLAPNEDNVPLFVQADFGLIRDENGDLQPRLVEIQGFPSLYAYQPLLAETYRDAYQIDSSLPYLPHGQSHSRYFARLREAIVGEHDPEHVVLLEVDPAHQKTRVDFVLTERECGVRTVDIRHVRRRGRELFCSQGGRDVPIRRIYNRVIVDELERRGDEIPFAWSDDLKVEWAGHPNWFFLLSKFSLPWLQHECVPETYFLHEAPEVETLSAWVLKPLYSFAGMGVVVGPTEADLAAIPQDRRRDYILQRRMEFAPVMQTPHGPTQVEIRMMYLWTGARPELVNIILRTGRGKMMGVDHNKGLSWVGASAAFLVDE